MSIEMMQRLVFETDDLDMMEIMLRAAVRCAFQEERGTYRQLHLNVKQKDFTFDDGRKYYFDEQPKIMPVGTEYRLVRTDRIYGGATLLTSIASYDDLDVAARKSNEMHKAHRKEHPTRLWVTTLGDYQENQKDGDPVFQTYDEMVEAAMILLRTAQKEKAQEFWKACGDGITTGFNDNDGDIDIGFSLRRRAMGGWNLLDLSLIHLYYGK